MEGGPNGMAGHPLGATSNADFALFLEKERRDDVPRQLRRRMSRLRRESLAKLELEGQTQRRNQVPLPAQTQVKIPEQKVEVEKSKDVPPLEKPKSSFSLDLSSPSTKKRKRKRKKKTFAPLGPEQKGFDRLYDTKLQATLVAEDERVYLGPVPHADVLATRKERRQRLRERRAELRAQSQKSTTVSNALGLISRHLRGFEKQQREEDDMATQRAKIATRKLVSCGTTILNETACLENLSPRASSSTSSLSKQSAPPGVLQS